MYTTGLELQQKLDKIIDYDKCNPDTARVMGFKDYCNELFKDQKFLFWQGNELSQHCGSIDKAIKDSKNKDECAVLNNHVFGAYHEDQSKILKEI